MLGFFPVGFGNKGFNNKARGKDYWLGISNRNAKWLKFLAAHRGMHPTSINISGLSIH